MRLRNTLLLTAVFIGLGVYVYFFELRKGGEEKGARLLSFKEEEVESIILSYPQQEIRLKKESSGKWKMTQPLQVAADESTVRSLLSSLNSTEVIRTVEQKPSPEDLRAFGLEQPVVQLSITLKNGITLPSILVGSKTPFGNSVYVKREREHGVLLTSGSLRSILEKKLEEFSHKQIDKQLTDFIEEEKKEARPESSLSRGSR